MHMDGKSISAAILHDVIEDTETVKDQIAKEFGKDVAELVDGVSKITRIEFQTQEEAQAENFRKMLLAMASDIRVILIKLADRLHNMRTVSALPHARQRAIARETLDIYAPIANRLGVRQWSIELEDLSFATIFPLRYRILAEAVRRRHGNRKAIVERVRTAIINQLEHEGLHAEITGREKNLYGIYKKMQHKRLSFEQVFDVYGFRIIVDKADDCYRALGVIHNLYKPIPGRFKDYIAIPKANGYQSLHTVVFGPFGISIEVQIRTREMHRVADAGVASHWLYKSGDTQADHVQQRALQWLKDLLETQQKAGNPREFLEHLKIDLFPDEVYVFTPNGEIKKLPRDATVIDFAYDVHTDVGNHCVGAKVNYRLVPLRTTLCNGDHVEIITSDWSHPNPMWLDYVVTSKARAHIRSYLKNLRVGEAVKLGGRLMEKAIQTLGSDGSRVSESQRSTLLRTLKLKDWNQLLSEIGLGNRQAIVVARQLIPEPSVKTSRTGFVFPMKWRGKKKCKAPVFAIRGTEGVVVTYARCCCPIPGDPILGFLSAGRGIVVHTEGCPNVAKYRKHPEQWLDVQWEQDIEGVFPVGFRVEAKNQRGVLASVAAAIAEQEANIDTVSFDDRDGRYTTMDFVVEVRDRAHLAKIMRQIRSLETVARINRKKG
ncbi:MAG: bifunctional GTP diphosphokinase/guanosine-3',5'-bis pyrophosphate 3'-pyrophosphohydrolase [Gammaproteobacteria bacterium]|nr:MAG: bifunctional GTP diphosphokinase/guanosine-3',5'-bis pyrophosphate 3'-pyrophosphohydrolase [Gammaproteobacteria bacterium]